MVQRSSPAPFLLKTYELVDEPMMDEVISWNETGTGFVVWKTADFARDLLPNSFKHNNFSSFVRQLNTYGFHKTVPDKWEFSNQYFKRGRKELLIQIHRRKTATSPPKGDVVGSACSGDDPGSSSTSSRDSKNHGSVDVPSGQKLETLSGENDKLRKEIECLTTEIAKSKKNWDGLMVFLSQCAELGPEKISRITSGDMAVGETVREIDGNDDDDEKDGECFRLFGVLLKDEKKKRGRDVINETSGALIKNMKVRREFNNEISWMNSPCSVTEQYNKV